MGRFDTLKKLIAGTGAGAVGAGVLTAPTEEAEAGPLAEALKEFIKKYPNKQQLKNVLEEMYKAPGMKQGSFMRDEYGDFIVSEAKKRHAPLEKMTLDRPSSILDADSYIQDQLGTNLNTRLVLSKDLENDPLLRQQMYENIKKVFPTYSENEINTRVNKELKALSTARGFTFGDSNYIVTDKNKNANDILQSLIHEPYHKLDALSGKTIKNHLYNPDTIQNISKEAREHLKTIPESVLLSDTAHSIPEDTGGFWLDWNALDRKKLGPLVLARENPEVLEDYVKISKKVLDDQDQSTIDNIKKKVWIDRSADENKQLIQLDEKEKKLKHQKLLELYPEYNLIEPSVAHSTNLYKGIEKSLADDLLLKDIDPLSKERAQSFLTSDMTKKAAGLAGASLLGSNVQAATKSDIKESDISPLNKLQTLLKSYRSNVSEPIANTLKGQLTPDIKIGNKNYTTSSPVTDMGIDVLSDPLTYVPGSPGAGLGLLELMSELGKKEK